MGTEYANVKSIGRLFSIVESILELDEPTLANISDETDIPESTVYRYLSKLDDMGYIHRDGSEYQIGLFFVEIGRSARTRKAAFDYAKPITKKLGKETKERAQFIAQENWEGVFVHVGIGENAVETDTYIDKYSTYLGRRIPLHATASGKAILSGYDNEKLKEFARTEGLETYTDRTITDVNELISEIEDIRENGVSINNQEYIKGLWSTAVPVESDGEICGALGVSIPVERLRRDLSEEEVIDKVKAAVNELQLRIEYAGGEEVYS